MRSWPVSRVGFLCSSSFSGVANLFAVAMPQPSARCQRCGETSLIPGIGRAWAPGVVPKGNALGGFMRARQDQVQPEDVGLVAGGRRRARGLRREELAMLAVISVEYYLRLERGHVQHPSPQTLGALARALQLDAKASRYLYGIGGSASPAIYDREPPKLPLDALIISSWRRLTRRAATWMCWRQTRSRERSHRNSRRDKLPALAPVRPRGAAALRRLGRSDRFRGQHGAGQRLGCRTRGTARAVCAGAKLQRGDSSFRLTVALLAADLRSGGGGERQRPG